MALSQKLQEDLLKEFGEEKKLVLNQLELIQPLGLQLRKPVAQRVINNTLNVLYEIILYILSLGSIALIFFINYLYPFFVLSLLKDRSDLSSIVGISNAQVLYWTVCGMFISIAVLFFTMARMTRRLRQKNKILQMAARDMKAIIEQHLVRKAAIETIEQRNFMNSDASIQALPDTTGIDDVPNPGYGD